METESLGQDIYNGECGELLRKKSSMHEWEYRYRLLESYLRFTIKLYDLNEKEGFDKHLQYLRLFTTPRKTMQNESGKG